MGLGSGIRKKPIPDPGPGVKKAPDPGSGSAKLHRPSQHSKQPPLTIYEDVSLRFMISFFGADSWCACCTSWALTRRMSTRIYERPCAVRPSSGELHNITVYVNKVTVQPHLYKVSDPNPNVSVFMTQIKCKNLQLKSFY
jgi:hypothetical protein